MKQRAVQLASILLFLGSMAISGAAQVQLISHTSATNQSNGTGTINTTGANFFAVCEVGPYGPIVPTDSVGTNTYVLAASAANPGYWGVYLYVSYNPTTSTSEKWSVNAGGYPATVQAYSGVASADKSAGANQATPLVIPAVTPTNANELIESCFQPQAGSVSSPLTIIDSTGGAAGISAAYQIQTSATPVGVTWTEPSGNQQANVGLTASFYSTLTPANLVPTVSLPEGFVGSSYNYQLTVTGGVTPYTWRVTSGTLPTGLNMTNGGLISGTPSAAISAPLVFMVTDGQGHTASTQSIALTVAASPLSIATGTCPAGTQYLAYAGCTIAAAGGTAPYTYTWAGETPWTGQLAPANGNYAALVEGLTLNSATGAITGTIAGEGVYTILFVVADAAGNTVTRPILFNIAGDNSMAGCSYPSDSIYYQNVSTLPVDTSPAAPVWSGYQSSSIRAGFGQYGTTPDGIPFYRVPYNQPMVPVSADYNLFPGTQGPIPFNAPMEGTRNAPGVNPVPDYTGDNHVLVLQTAGGGKGCAEYDMYQIYPNYPNTNNAWGDGLGDGVPGYTNGYWDMTGYAMVPQDQGAADAAGMPIIPFLENYDEVLGTGAPGAENGVIKEPKRFTLEHTLNYHVWPATSSAGLGGNTCSGGYEDYNELLSQLHPPTSCGASGGMTGPMGEIYRLKASVATPACAAASPQARIIIQGFRDHGIILADNGISGMVIGTPDTRWDNNQLGCLGNLHLSDFEPVVVESLAKNWPTSSQVITPPPVITSPSGATVTITGIGTVTLQASQAAAPGYAASTTTVTFNVSGATPSLAFQPISTQTFGAWPVILAATSNSTGAITYSLLSGPATLSGTTLTTTALGTITVQASQAAAGGYTATTITDSFNVVGATPTLLFQPVANQVAGAAPFNITATSNSPGSIAYSVVSGNATVAGNTVTLTGVGTVTLQASQAAVGAYTAVTATTTFNVSSGANTLNFITVPSQSYGASPIAVSATSNSSGAITYSVVSGPATISGSTVTLTGAGTVFLQASQAAAGGFPAATTTTSFNVNGIAPTLNFAAVPSQTYGAAPFAVFAVSNSTGAITYSVVSGPATISGSTITLTGSGGVTLQASQAAAGGYNAATANVTFNVAGATPTLNFAAVANQTYGAAPFAVSATSNSTGAITYSVVSGPATIAGNMVTLTGSGSVTLQASQAAAGGYNAATSNVTFNVNSTSTTLNFTPIAVQTYGATPFAVSATSNSSGTITYSVVSGAATIAGNMVTLTGSGSVTLMASQAASGSYAAATANVTFTVSGATPTLTFASVPSQTYGTAPFAVSATSNSTGAITYSVISGPATIAGNTITITGGGTVMLQASQAATGSFTTATATTSFSVSGATSSLAFATIPSQSFGAAPFAVSATSNSTGTITYSVVGGSATISGNTVTLTGAGTVTLQASQAAAGGYISTTATTSFSVTGATPTLNFVAVANQTYGAVPFAVSTTSNSTGAITYSVVSGPATIAGNTVTITGAGTVTLQASQAAAGGYISTTATTSFSVTGATPTLNFVAVANQTYGAVPFAVSTTSNSTGAITYSVASGPATIAGNTVTLTGAGTVTLMASQAAAGSFTATAATISFNVTGATPTLTFAAVPAQIYGAAPFAVSAVSTSSGAITYSVVSGQATITGNMVTITGAGTVILQATQAAAGNFAAQTANVSFNVNPVTPNLTFAAIPNHTFGDAAFNVSATSASSGTVRYSVQSGSATVSGNSVTLTGTGTVVLAASQVAAGNYAPASATISFTVATPTGDFSLPANFPSITIPQGQTASFIIAVTSLHGFAGNITMQCAVPTPMLPASCAGTAVQLTASSTANSNVTVMTAPSLAATRETPAPFGGHGRSLAMLALLAPLGFPLWKRRKGVWVLLALAAVFAGGLTGCSGGVVQTTASPGTYTVAVNATSGAITHTMNLTVIVK